MILEPVQSLLSKESQRGQMDDCRLVLSSRSQFFHNRLFLSSQAKLRSTTQRLGMTLKVCSSLRLAICTVTCPPGVLHPLRKGLYVAAISQQALYPAQPGLNAPAPAALPFTIGHLSRRHRHRVRQSPACPPQCGA